MPGGGLPVSHLGAMAYSVQGHRLWTQAPSGLEPWLSLRTSGKLLNFSLCLSFPIWKMGLLIRLIWGRCRVNTTECVSILQ